MKPTIGRIVHFRYRGAPADFPPKAAIVAAIPSYRVGWMLLAVLTCDPHAPIEYREVPIEGDDPKAPGTWCWPPREVAQ